MDIQVIVLSVASFLGAVVTIITASATIYKYLKKATVNIVRNDVSGAIEEAVKSGTEDIREDVQRIKEKLADYTETSDRDISIIKKTLQDSIRDTITKIHKACITASYIGEHEMYIVEQLFNDYKSLDGNTFVPNLMEDLRELYKSCHSGKGADFKKWSE